MPTICGIPGFGRVRKRDTLGGMASPRYMAEHMIMPAFLRELGATAVLDAIQWRDADFFIPVWMGAGFRFSPVLLYTQRGDWRIGAITLPQPRESSEAYFAAFVGRTSDSGACRYFLLESAESVMDQRRYTVLGEWAGTTHRNYGEGPPFTGDLVNDHAAFVDAVVEVCASG